ncbi:MAG: TolC family protein [Alphaproteobacteria bacterium]|nr:TolC family protein [Alphaproteobacteria bacterium]
MKKNVFLAVLFLVCTSFAAHADSLNEIIGYTLQSNPEMAAVQAQKKAVSAQKGRFSSGYKPRVDLVGDVAAERREYTVTGAPNEIKEDETPYSYGVRAQMNLYEGGKTLYAVRAAEYREKAEDSAVAEKRSDLVYRVIRSYLDYMDAVDVQTLRRNNADVLRAYYVETRDKAALGRGTSTDVAQAEARLQRARAALTQADMSVSNAQEAFFRLTGKTAEYDKTLSIRSIISEKPESENEKFIYALTKDGPRSLEAAEQTAERENLKIKELNERENAARENIKVSKNTSSPSLDLSLYAGRQEKPMMMDDYTNYQAKLALTIPLYDASTSHYKSEEAAEQLNVVRAQIDNMKAAVRERVRIAWNDLRSHKAEIDYAQAQIRANEKALSGVRDEAAHGSRTTLDVLNAQQELLDSKVSLAHAEYGMIKSYVALMNAMGTLKY